jgi:hypothetical protein
MLLQADLPNPFLPGRRPPDGDDNSSSGSEGDDDDDDWSDEGEYEIKPDQTAPAAVGGRLA